MFPTILDHLLLHTVGTSRKIHAGISTHHDTAEGHNMTLLIELLCYDTIYDPHTSSFLDSKNALAGGPHSLMIQACWGRVWPPWGRIYWLKV